MTDELYRKIMKAVEDCEHKNKQMGVDICKMEILPCERTIDAGKCPVIISVMKGKKND